MINSLPHCNYAKRFGQWWTASGTHWHWTLYSLSSVRPKIKTRGKGENTGKWQGKHGKFDLHRSVVAQHYGKFIMNKKVLLREPKRHTARRVASPWEVGTYLGQGGPTLAGRRGNYLGRGYLPWSRGGYLPWWLGGTYLGWGGYPPWPWGSTPPQVWTDRHLWKQYLPVVLRTRAVINY